MNKAITWIKEHPGTSIAVGLGIFVVIYLASRSSGSSTGSSGDVAAIENSQLQQEQLANQNAVVEAQYQAQENQTALAAQVQNNQLAAELAAQVSNNQVTQNTAQLAAQVQEQQTGAQENVANNTINAELAAQQSQVAAESQGLKTEFSYLTQVNNNQTQLAETIAPGAEQALLTHSTLMSSEGTNILDTILGDQGSAVAASEEGGVGLNANASEQENLVNNIFGSISNAFSGLFA